MIFKAVVKSACLFTAVFDYCKEQIFMFAFKPPKASDVPFMYKGKE